MIDTSVITTVPKLLAAHAANRPDHVAYTDTRQSLTYAQLEARTATLAGHLVDLGMADGDSLLLYLDNSVEVVEGYLVAPRAGVVTVCANPTATVPELTYIAENSSATVAVVDTAHLPAMLASIRAGSLDIRTVLVTGDDPDLSGTVELPPDVRLVGYDALLARDPQAAAPDDTDLDTCCWMLYTSGTTGRPKGVHLTQRGCLWVVAACWIPIAELSSDDHLLSCLPLFHSYALVLSVVGVTAAGARATLLPKFSPRDVAARLASDGVTVFPGVPTMFQYLLNSRSEAGRLHAPDLRLCISAGAIMSGSLNEEFDDYAGVPLLDGYGITETSTMVTMNAPRGGRVPGSCGVPLPGVSVRFVDASGSDVPAGEEGELWVQGPNVMLGYHRLPEATAASLTNGWYRTGDLGRRDPNGFVTITGRVKELIIRAGENIAPAEIETVIFSCPGVEDVAVVGEPHRDLGEVPVAFIVATSGQPLDHEAVFAVCRENLAYFKVPSRIVEVSEIPRTGSGKIRRFELKTKPGSSTHAAPGAGAADPSTPSSPEAASPPMKAASPLT
ncbi:class I adenylate-forming enzyme family protein [Nocardioides sp.]|uniref:class I adenylate-forming enzyme family protein n=1 Tax=Nocardioides sp. TaxID=35761 RepID=UPI0026275A34|nr:class I adenylate-forming enzyme family protein [Nocardioides sp.]MCW2736256.1 modular polyketide synthase [Nocardioides sp.]